MTLTGRVLLAVCVLAVVGLPALVVHAWGRVRGPRAVRVAQRVVAIAACQAAAVAVTAVGINDHFRFYASWSDLLGSSPGDAAIVPAAAARDDAAVPHAVPIDNGGWLLRVNVNGVRSGVRAAMYVLLPPGYTSPAMRRHRYPVIEFLPGHPGTPDTVLAALNLETALSAEIVAHRMPPVIGVLPPTNVAGLRDLECADVAPRGPRVDTFLTSDVRAFVVAHFRAATTPAAWGALGLSEGGFCAAKLAMLHPANFRAAVSLEGFFTAGQSAHTAALYPSAAARDESSPLWLAQHRPPPVTLLLMTTRQDRDSYGPTLQMLRAVRAPTRVASIVLPRGGHNLNVWSAVLPSCLDWLGARLRP